jgi:hypothetical protein
VPVAPWVNHQRIEGAAMASVYNQAAVNCGGSCEEFDQTIYINATGWGNPNIKSRGGALVTGEGLKGGVCMALSSVYLSKKGNFVDFKTYLASPGGLAWIRGMMNLFSEGCRVGGVKSYAHMYTLFPDMLKTLGVSYTGQQRTAENPLVAEGVNGFTSSLDGLYFINFWGTSNGHAVAAIKTGESYRFFDPNFGNATLGDKAGFNRFVTWLFPTYYPDLNHHWIVQRFSL